MKKLVLLVLCLFMLVGCVMVEEPDSSESEVSSAISASENDTSNEKNSDCNSIPPNTIPPVDFYIGQSVDAYTQKYNLDFLAIPANLAAYIGEEAFMDWIYQFKKQGGVREDIEMTILNFVKETGIKKEDFQSYSDTYRGYFNRDQLTSLYSGDQKFVNRSFASSTAVYYAGEIYTPQWFVDHTPDDYERVGLTRGHLALKVRDWRELLNDDQFSKVMNAVERYTEDGKIDYRRGWNKPDSLNGLTVGSHKKDVEKLLGKDYITEPYENAHGVMDVECVYWIYKDGSSILVEEESGAVIEIVISKKGIKTALGFGIGDHFGDAADAYNKVYDYATSRHGGFYLESSFQLSKEVWIIFFTDDTINQSISDYRSDDSVITEIVMLKTKLLD